MKHLEYQTALTYKQKWGAVALLLLCLLQALVLQVSLVAQTVKNLPAMQETGVQSLGQEDPLEKEWLPAPMFLPGESHGQRSPVGYSPRGHKESDTTQRLTL